MKNTFFTITFFFGLAMFIGQTIKVEYEEVGNVYNQLKDKNLDEATYKRVSAHLAQPKYYTLIHQGNESLYSANQSKNQKSSNRVQEMGDSEYGLYKNFGSNNFIKDSNISGNLILIEDRLDLIDWNITNETKNIGSFNCTKATGILNGKDVIAWYTSDIPISDGPNYFQGLPGLIVSLTTPEKVYNALGYSVSKKNEKFTIPSKGKKMNLKEYDNHILEMVNSIKKNNGKMMIKN